MTEAPIGVIGSGLGGLAAACTLAARGYPVTVFEANPWVGGKAAVLEDGGYRFDMGPTILTVPSVLRRIFDEAGERLEDWLDLRRCDPQWRCFFDDGSVLDLRQENAAMKQELERFHPGSSSGYEDFLAFSKQLDKVSQNYFFYKSVGGISDTFDWKGSLDLKTLKDVMSMRMGVSVFDAVRKHVKEPRVAQMLDHFTQYVGSAPDQSPAVLCGIAHMQTDEGVWYPIGGTRAVPTSLEGLARKLGVQFRTEAEVSRIVLDGKRASGLQLKSGETVKLSAVVSNMDSYRTHRELLEGTPAQRKFDRKNRRDPACSGVVLYLGLKKAYEHLEHHNFVFSKDPEAEFEDIYRRGEPADDLTAYICAPSRTEPGVAPDGGEALYILVHAPYLRDHHDWNAMLPDYRRKILDKLGRSAGMEDLEERIEVEHALTPQDIHDRYRVLQGAIYGIASHGKFQGAFKPANRSKLVSGLYLAGGAAHPGPGMPMVMMSGWIAGDALDSDGIASRSQSHTASAAAVG
ncbi:MAG: phytoene desaturase family protein [Planctomycetota bacterium]